MIAEAAEGRLVCRFAGIGKLVLWVALLGRLVLQAIPPATLPVLPPVAEAFGQPLGLGGLAGRFDGVSVSCLLVALFGGSWFIS